MSHFGRHRESNTVACSFPDVNESDTLGVNCVLNHRLAAIMPPVISDYLRETLLCPRQGVQHAQDWVIEGDADSQQNGITESTEHTINM